MTKEEIHAAAEANHTLFCATIPELEDALQHATREIHKYVIGREIKYRKKKRPMSRTDGMTKGHLAGRCPSKRDLH